MTGTSEIRETLRAYVRDNFLYMRPDAAVGDDDSLLARGVVDSLGVMELVGFVEERWAVAVDPADITEDNFGSIAGMERYVAARRAAVRT